MNVEANVAFFIAAPISIACLRLKGVFVKLS
jgi:hypothetical protein